MLSTLYVSLTLVNTLWINFFLVIHKVNQQKGKKVLAWN